MGIEGLVGRGIRSAEAVSPRAGAALALRVFMAVPRPPAVRDDQRPTMERARRSVLRVPGLARSGAEVRVYEWGTGSDVVVLAHGWGGRAAQFAPLVRELVFEGFRVVAFDAPAHGASPGRGTYLVDWMDTLTALQQRYGLFHGIVGHSFGALASLVVAAEGVSVRRVVTVAAPADPDTLLDRFRADVGFDTRTGAALRSRFARRFFPNEIDPFTRMSAAAHPLPATTPLLLVHDRGDRIVPVGDLHRLAAVNPRARMLVTERLGHNRILASDAFLDATLGFLASPTAPGAGSAPSAPVAVERTK